VDTFVVVLLTTGIVILAAGTSYNTTQITALRERLGTLERGGR
jgi:hypothetical protein